MPHAHGPETVAALRSAVGADVLADAASIQPHYLTDWVVPMVHGAPLALARPRTTGDVSALLRECHRLGIPVVPQGGRTGTVGGATPIDGCVILSLERLTGIEEIDEAAATMTVRAGTSLQTIQEAAWNAGLFFPLDLGARGTCQIGGAVATNAGGNRVIRYGMTRDLVLGLEVVLADGTILLSLNKFIKNNAGLDIRQVFIGSEGLLGVITRVVLRLHPQPRSTCTAFCAVTDFDHVIALLKHARASLGGSLSAFEMMWNEFYTTVTAPGPGGLAPPLPRGAVGYLLIETLGADQAADQARFEQMLSDALESGIIVDGVVAQTSAEARAFWRIRDSAGELPRLHGPDTNFDIGIPTKDIGRFIDALTAAGRARWPDTKAVFFGHVGDSNLHLHMKVQEGEQPVEAIDDFVYDLVREWGGTVSAEHGIGLRKRPYLAYTRTPEEINVMRALKRALDPSGILNPGKVL